MKPDLSPLWTKVCVEDDVKAFEVLYYLLFNKLIKFCIYYVGRKEVAEEIISDIFVRCWENRKAETVILNLETYLFTAVRNQSLKYIKKNANIHLVEIEPANEFQLMDNTNPEKQLENKELHHKLDEAIDKLPQQARIIFKLIKENGMKYKEVAEILEISPRTVQTQLFRAIDKLRISLKAYQHIYTKNKPDNNTIDLTVLIFFLHIFHFL
ncbi:RNA polymerase ECF-type sigma factor [Pedobacter cryoconitis]|uniref:RNA polymerase ECF-type sigma factor n=1 Tax=Pedobacter cryoconitis TaxID=188932 RepID=A0A127VH00_9SPHI|nr:RNA polymerase sigma-70 factor [Pedobacter cryoconitis]AMQ00606.1 RNA polymerase ECF-type sigma factor [Pedobacter cryoconitis]